MIEPIVKDSSDTYTHIKINDYRCDINKDYFVSTPHSGLDTLVGWDGVCNELRIKAITTMTIYNNKVLLLIGGTRLITEVVEVRHFLEQGVGQVRAYSGEIMV